MMNTMMRRIFVSLRLSRRHCHITSLLKSFLLWSRLLIYLHGWSLKTHPLWKVGLELLSIVYYHFIHCLPPPFGPLSLLAWKYDSSERMKRPGEDFIRHLYARPSYPLPRQAIFRRLRSLIHLQSGQELPREMTDSCLVTWTSNTLTGQKSRKSVHWHCIPVGGLFFLLCASSTYTIIYQNILF